jgi:uncharacterized repeat protein (TIGR03803 family)
MTMHRTRAATFALTCAAVSAATVAPAVAGGFKLLYSFQGGSNDGANPQGALTADGRMLFGTTISGGSADAGTIFSWDPKTGVEKVLHAFGSSGDGMSPAAAMLKVGDMLYGTTTGGGSAGQGTVFSFDPKTGVEKIIYAFQGGSDDGAYPQARMIDVDGTLYGTTMQGGSANCYLFGCGTVFSIDLASGAEKSIYFFQEGNDGANPGGSLLRLGHKLYGTTVSGGAGDCGTVFVLDPATGAETVLHNFNHQGDGNNPGSGLVNVGGMLYGTTIAGGAGDPGVGVVFAFSPKTGAEQVVYAFEDARGAIPEDSLIQVGSALYATTSLGGASNNGSVFSLDPATHAEKVVHSFQGSDGSDPWADLIEVGNHLYGTAYYGGSANAGVVFEITP